MHIWRCVMMEESCPTTEGYRGNNICYVCISWNEPVLHAQDDTLTQIKKKKEEIYWICVWLTAGFDHLALRVTQA